MVAAVVVAACALAACGSSPAGSTPAGSTPTGATPTGSTAVYGRGPLAAIHCRTGPPDHCAGLLPAAPGITDALVLDHRSVPAGTTVAGAVVVTNRTGRTVSLLDPHGCRPSVGVGLVRGATFVAPGFALPCLPRAIVLPPGVTRVPVQTVTTWTSCSAHVATAGRAGLPACRPGPRLPDLAAGRYRAVVVGLGLALPPAGTGLTVTAG